LNASISIARQMYMYTIQVHKVNGSFQAVTNTSKISGELLKKLQVYTQTDRHCPQLYATSSTLDIFLQGQIISV